MAVGHRPGWPSCASSRDTSPLTLQPPRPFKARDPVLMPGDPRLGIVLSGPQAPWGSPSPRCAMSGRFHLRQPRRPRSPHATALRFRCPAPRRPDKCAGLAERMSLDGPNGGSGPDADRGRFGRGPNGTGGTRLGTSAPRPPSERGALPRTGRSPSSPSRRPSEATQRVGEPRSDLVSGGLPCRGHRRTPRAYSDAWRRLGLGQGQHPTPVRRVTGLRPRPARLPHCKSAGRGLYPSASGL